jgi:hypothetical protein
MSYILRMIPTRWTDILYDTFSDIISGIPSNIYSDILHGILPDVYSNILSGILCGILSDILRRWGAAVPTDIWRSLRSSSAHWDLEVGWGRGGEEEKRVGNQNFSQESRVPQQVLCKMMGVKMWFWTITIIHSHTKSKFEATLGRFFPCLPAVMLTSLWGRVVSLPMITIPCPTLRPGHQICSLFPLLFGRLPAASGSHDAFPDAFFNHSGSMIWIQQPINKVLFGHDKHCILTYILKKIF